MRWKEIEAVFDRSGRKLYIIAMGVTGNRPMAEDAVHQALVAFLSSGSDPVNMEAYLCRCVRHEALRAVAGRKQFVPIASEFLAETVDSGTPRARGRGLCKAGMRGDGCANERSERDDYYAYLRRHDVSRNLGDPGNANGAR